MHALELCTIRLDALAFWESSCSLHGCNDNCAPHSNHRAHWVYRQSLRYNWLLIAWKMNEGWHWGSCHSVGLELECCDKKLKNDANLNGSVLSSDQSWGPRSRQGSINGQQKLTVMILEESEWKCWTFMEPWNPQVAEWRRTFGAYTIRTDTYYDSSLLRIWPVLESLVSDLMVYREPISLLAKQILLRTHSHTTMKSPEGTGKSVEMNTSFGIRDDPSFPNATRSFLYRIATQFTRSLFFFFIAL